MRSSYPGHRDQVHLLVSAGFFDVEREVHGTRISPRDVSARLLSGQWLQEDDDHDVTVMRIVVEGERSGTALRVSYDLHDRYDRGQNISSIARTTGTPARQWLDLWPVELMIAVGSCLPS